jgi:predicted dehydrogenase
VSAPGAAGRVAERVRLGFIGCGSVVRVMFGPFFRDLTEGRVTAVADVDEASARYVQDLYGIPHAFTDHRDLLTRAPVEAVVVGTPPHLHEEQVLAAARAGKHVLCEKPLAPTAAACRRMIDACREAGVLLSVGFMKRYQPSLLRVREMIARGDLGRVRHARADWGGVGVPSLRTGPAADRRLAWKPLIPGGGVVHDLFSHTADLFRWLLGDVILVSAEVAVTSPDRAVDDAAVVTCRHATGVTSVHTINYFSRRPWRERYEMDGEGATLQARATGESWISTHGFELTLFDGPPPRATRLTPNELEAFDLELRRNGQYLRELEHFCRAVRGEEPLQVAGEDGLRAAELVSAAYLSAWRGTKVAIPLAEDEPDLGLLLADLKARLHPGSP